jgi:hypothetical protein
MMFTFAAPVTTFFGSSTNRPVIPGGATRSRSAPCLICALEEDRSVWGLVVTGNFLHERDDPASQGDINSHERSYQP